MFTVSIMITLLTTIIQMPYKASR